jgi:anaerobic selenocysteine-containing dehydrogenase
VAALAEEMLTPGEGQIKAFITNSGNPVLSTPNGTQLENALQNLEFFVAIDIYINETTCHANIILPPATGLETAHYDLIFHHLAVSNHAKYSEATLPKTEGAKYDWEIFEELRNRLTLSPGGTLKAPRDPADKLELGLKSGTYKLSLEQLRENPHGIDLGALEPRLPERLLTPNKRLQLAPDLLVADLTRAKIELEQPSPELVLIGRRELRSNNSWMHNSERLVRGKNRCTLMIHPTDAAKKGISEGSSVQVVSRVGSVELPAEITENIMPGVVSIPHGYGHTRNGIKLEVASQNAGVSINDLTDELELDDLTGNAAFCGVNVNVQMI